MSSSCANTMRIIFIVASQFLSISTYHASNWQHKIQVSVTHVMVSILYSSSAHFTCRCAGFASVFMLYHYLTLTPEDELQSIIAISSSLGSTVRIYPEMTPSLVNYTGSTPGVMSVALVVTEAGAFVEAVRLPVWLAVFEALWRRQHNVCDGPAREPATCLAICEFAVEIKKLKEFNW